MLQKQVQHVETTIEEAQKRWDINFEAKKEVDVGTWALIGFPQMCVLVSNNAIEGYHPQLDEAVEAFQANTNGRVPIRVVRTRQWPLFIAKK